MPGPEGPTHLESVKARSRLQAPAGSAHFDADVASAFSFAGSLPVRARTWFLRAVSTAPSNSVIQLAPGRTVRVRNNERSFLDSNCPSSTPLSDKCSTSGLWAPTLCAKANQGRFFTLLFAPSCLRFSTCSQMPVSAHLHGDVPFSERQVAASQGHGVKPPKPSCAHGARALPWDLGLLMRLLRNLVSQL